MITRANGIVIECMPRKVALRARDAGRAAEVLDVPKYTFELVKTHESCVEHVMTPLASDMRKLLKQGYEFVATHEARGF